MSLALTARWIFPVSGPPIPQGVVVIDGERITAVVPAGERAADIDLGNAAILPGLVNAHTHLDLSDAAGVCPPNRDFTLWLRRVIVHRRTQADPVAAVRKGIDESLRFGVTALGDISAQGASWDLLAGAGIDGTVYRELIGLSAERADASIDVADTWREKESNAWRIAGLSPHAPYTVGRRLLERLPPARVAVHLAETREELDLLRRREGPFVDFLKDLGVWHPDELMPDVDAFINPFWTVIHGNYLDPAGPLPSTMVYCPRTHTAFGHPPYPLREFLARGVQVALGTDSLASNPDLNVLAEARHVFERFPDLPGETLLRMITTDAANILGVAAGRLYWTANLVVLPLPDRDEADPHRLLWDSDKNVDRVMVRGKWLEFRL